MGHISNPRNTILTGHIQVFSLLLYAHNDGGMTKPKIHQFIIHGFRMNNSSVVFNLFLCFFEGDLAFTQYCFVQSFVKFGHLVLALGSWSNIRLMPKILHYLNVS